MATTTITTPLPTPTPTVPRRPFSSFKLLSFDIYGTLIDWERGILEGLAPLVARIPTDAPAEIAQYRTINDESESKSDADNAGRLQLAAKFNEVEAAIQTEQPEALYSSILEQVYLRLAKEWLEKSNVVVEKDGGDQIRKEAQSFGAAIGSWPAFPDTVAAMRRLRNHYRFLIPLSNVDRASFARTQTGPLAGVDFFTVYTAQDIGSYKPDLRNFEYLVSHADTDTGGVAKHEILHVAQSLFHDHVPAKQFGLSSVWINRHNAGMGSGKGIEALHENAEVGYGWRFRSLAEFADEVERQLAEEEKEKGKGQ